MKLVIVSYILAHLWDYYLTVCGLILEVAKEGNPIANYMIKAYGMWIGLAIHKILFMSLVAIGLIIINKYSKTYTKPLLVVASIATFIGGSLWLLHW